MKHIVYVGKEVPKLMLSCGIISRYTCKDDIIKMYRRSDEVRNDRITGVIVWPEDVPFNWDEIEISPEMALFIAQNNEFEIAQKELGLNEKPFSTITKAFTNLITAA